MDADRKVAQEEAKRRIVEAILLQKPPGGFKPLKGAGLSEYPRQGHRTMAVRG